MPFEERLALIRRGADECWLWPWAQTPRGYGHFRRDKRTMYAHRAAYELLVGPIPEGAHLDHQCETTSCCNPAHVLLTHARPHAKRHAAKRAAERTHCHRGHPLLPETDTTWHQNTDGTRICRLCYEGWNAVRYDSAARNEYRRLGRQSGATKRRLPVDTDALLAKHQVKRRATHCRKGHERAIHGWHEYPNGDRVCAACYAGWHERRAARRASNRTAPHQIPEPLQGA